MASENMAVNGNYASQQAYSGMEPSFNPYAPASAHSAPHLPPTATPAPDQATASSSSQSDVPKDEVGWFFVEQYYTTLSRSPEKLYLFYNKRSQFVSGQETDKVAVCVGQRAINDRIRELDFHDCKVRVTNVDAQASESNIVIQVIGEISNKSQPHQKFTQTFVLCPQVNGYFVLNDIFRYLVDEEAEQQPQPQQQQQQQQQPQATTADDVPAAETSGIREPVPTVEETEPKTLTSSADPAAIESHAKQVDQELEEKVLKAPSAAEEPAAKVNGVASEELTAHAEDAPVSATSAPAQEEALQPEKPKDPEPTPAASPAKQEPPQPAAPPKPAAPKTWASLAASANKSAAPAPSAAVATPAVAPKSAQAPAKAAAPTPAASTAAAPAASSDASPAAANDQDEWTAVGGSHNRQQSRQVNAQQPEPQQHRGYIKHVHEGIDGPQLKAELQKIAELTYFDIARQKNCAFVDFKTADGYNAVMAANPFTLNGEQLFVEERRMRPGATAFGQRGNFGGQGRGRGGNSNSGNSNGTSRGNMQGGGGRGGFAPRGRGGQSMPRGRGGAQAA